SSDLMQSYRNGFIGVWLPRNMEGTLEVSYNGKTASHAIATKDDSQTCLTELPLR
ncbi:CueP family metal-binding protein, partial [Salmonella enterica]|uniref:CueP family metal-binding protein n=1 Tax=Salmonella enterica TaxID=28901 RepID=UPI001A914C59